MKDRSTLPGIQKRKAYFLTDDGVKVADEIWDKVSEATVRVVHPDGRSENCSLAEALERVELPLRHVDMLRYMDDSGTIDLSGLTSELVERDLSKHIEKQLVSYLNDLPRTRRFYGREEELKSWPTCWKQNLHQFSYQELQELEKPRYQPKFSTGSLTEENLLYHRCQDWEGSRAFLEACAEWLSSIGQNDLSDYLASTAVPKTSMAVNLIEDGLSDSPSLIVIDDLHKVGDDTLYSILKELTLRIHKLKEVDW